MATWLLWAAPPKLFGIDTGQAGMALGLSPPEKLVWATPLAVANMLVFALVWSSLFEHAAAAVHYWRDTR